MKINHCSPLLLVVLLAVIAGCAAPPQSHEASVSDTLVTTKIALPASTAQIPIDTIFSEISWIGTKPTGQHFGVFKIKSGFIALDGDQVKGGSLEISIASMKVNNINDASPDHSKFIRHMMSEDFFDVAKFPMAQFEILSVEPYVAASDGNASMVKGPNTVTDPTHSITGNLTLKEVTKTVTFPAKITIANGRVEAMAKFNIDRTTWNMSYRAEGSIEDNFINNTVNLGFVLRTLIPAQ